MANISLSSVFAVNNSIKAKPSKRAPKKDMPTGTFEATLCGIEDGSFLCEQTGAPVAYKMVKFKVGKVIHQVSLSRLFFPKAPSGSNPRERLAAILEASNTVDVTMTSRDYDYERGIRAGYIVVAR